MNKINTNLCFNKLILCTKINILTQYIVHDKNIMYHNIKMKALYINLRSKNFRYTKSEPMCITKR